MVYTILLISNTGCFFLNLYLGFDHEHYYWAMLPFNVLSIVLMIILIYREYKKSVD